MRCLIVDNYDSFTYNLHHILVDLGVDVDVVRNDKITLEEVDRYDKILLSPGPGIPSEAGLLLEIIERYAPTKSILGVCLGEQAIGEVFGAKLINLSDVYHGVATDVDVLLDDPIFEGLGSKFEAGRYHSWVVDKEGLPDCIEVVAQSEGDEMIMAIRHKSYDVRGVQFHPESVLTPQGAKIIENWLNMDTTKS